MKSSEALQEPLTGIVSAVMVALGSARQNWPPTFPNAAWY